jgi:hypothetical protein
MLVCVRRRELEYAELITVVGAPSDMVVTMAGTGSNACGRRNPVHPIGVVPPDGREL